MPVGDKNVAIRRNGYAGWPVEPLRAACGHSLLAERQEHLAFRAQLEDFLAHDDAAGVSRGHAENRLLVVDIGGPQVAIAVHREPVRIGKQSRAEALEKLAGGIELQDRGIRGAPADAGGRARRHHVEAPVKDPDVASRVDMHADHLAPAASVHILRKPGPALHQAVGVWQLARLGILRGLRARQSSERGDHSDPDVAAHKNVLPILSNSRADGVPLYVRSIQQRQTHFDGTRGRRIDVKPGFSRSRLLPRAAYSSIEILGGERCRFSVYSSYWRSVPQARSRSG